MSFGLALIYGVMRLINLSHAGTMMLGAFVTLTLNRAFHLGTAMVGFAGGLMTLLFSFTPDFGGPFQIKAFCVIVLGGLTSFVGVAIGSLLLALAESFGTLYMRASLQNLIAFGLLFIALVFMPGGVMGLLQRRRS